MSRGSIFITFTDRKRLEALLAISARTKNVIELADELERAITMAPEKIPPDIVTMNSKVRFCDEDTGEESVVTLVYPQDADVDHAKVSVLAPVGAALLGLSVGQSIDWTMPTGKTRRLRIISVLYQPEASGNFEL